MAKLWFSSDHHINHANLLYKFKSKCPDCGGSGVFDRIDVFDIPCFVCDGTGEIPMRPFTSLIEMHEVMVTRHNERVRPEDHWTCMGDVTMERSSTTKAWLKKEIAKYNGHKRLILGNHDHLPVADYLEVGFEKIMASNVIENLLFTHYPIHPMSIPRGKVNIHGHTHSNPSPAGRYINISVEMTNYAPLELSELKEMARVILEKEERSERKD